ncbi:cytochrome-c peroxidase [Methylosoma difficile]
MSKNLLIIIIVLFLKSFSSNAFAALTDEQNLGKRLFSDVNLSLNRNQSCASCHSLDKLSGKAPAFVDPLNAVQGTPVSLGSIEFATGRLNAPSIAYAAFTPEFHLEETDGLYVGGLFWNGRAKNLEDQAKKPFLNRVEMAMPNKWSVVSRLKEDAAYVRLFLKLYQLDLAGIPHVKDGQFKQQTPVAVEEVFQKMAQAIAAFERSSQFNKFNSKFDFVLAGKTRFTKQEEDGMHLFNGKGGCSLCHLSNAEKDSNGNITPPLFTDFTYDNIGLPRNLNIPDDPKPHLGLGERDEINAVDPDKLQWGKHKVMTLRNIAITPPYGHNGVFASLEQITHFYNTRDTLGRVADNLDANFGVTGWPKPEYPRNVNGDELGSIGLTDSEEQAIVAFMKTLTDDYPQWGKDPLVPPRTPSPFVLP